MITPTASDDLHALGALVRKHRVARGLTQEELAERAGVGISVETISNLERGKTRPYRSTLDAVAAALQLDQRSAAALLEAWRGVGTSVSDDSLRQGRAAAAGRDWAEAYRLLTEADKQAALDADDLAKLAESAWATAHYDDALRAREQAYARYVAAGNRPAAAALGVIIAADYILRLELAVASGWHSAAERLLENEAECGAHGMVAWAHGQIALVLRADFDASLRHSTSAIDIGKRTGDLDVQMLGLALRGRTLVKQARVAEGMGLIDEAMASAVNGQLGAWAAGFVYCNTLSVCQETADARRATEWTAATRRCNARDAIIPSSGHCRAHRAGILRQHGDWAEAEEDARCGCDELRHGDGLHIGMAMYEIGLIHLRRGDLNGAEDAFQRAHELGRPPQPGLALLRLAQGKADAALTSITSAVADDSADRLARNALLAAQVEIAQSVGKLEIARSALEEMRQIATTFDTPALHAELALAEASIQLADGQANKALVTLRRACRLWTEVRAPYEIAKARMGLAEAYHRLGDRDSAELELAAARSAFEHLGALPDLERAADLQAAGNNESDVAPGQ